MSWLDILEYDRYGPDVDSDDSVYVCRCCGRELYAEDMSMDLDLCKECLEEEE